MVPRRPAVTRAYLHGEQPLAFAHRGGGGLWPENTLEAFRGAIAAGCRYIETDLHLTRDGVIVVHHDPRLERTTNGVGPIKARSLSELRELDAGFHFTRDGGHSYPFRGKGVTIPTFEEALALPDEVRFNIEIKQREPSMARALWELIEKHTLHDRVLVAAAEDDIGHEFDRLARGRVARSPGVRGVLAFWAASRIGAVRLLAPSYDALQVPPRQGPLTVVDRRFVRAAHAAGVQVHVWTIDEPTEMRRLLLLGVDGLMSDRPDILMDVVQEFRAGSGA